MKSLTSFLIGFASIEASNFEPSPHNPVLANSSVENNLILSFIRETQVGFEIDELDARLTLFAEIRMVLQWRNMKLTG